MPARCDTKSPTRVPVISDSPSVTFAQFLRAFAAWDSLVFGAICIADLLTTLYWIRHGMASEANPWLAACLSRGTFYFCAAKLFSFVPVLTVAAIYRDRYPRFIPLALRVGMTAYLTVYLIGVGSQFFPMR